MRKRSSHNRRVVMSSARRRAREKRNERIRRIYLLSLQELPPEKIEKVFRDIVEGRVRLIGVREAPRQKVKHLGLTFLREP